MTTKRELWAKTIKVVNSARNMEQRKTARRYLQLAIPHLVKSNNHPMTGKEEREMYLFFISAGVAGLIMLYSLARLFILLLN
jgi:hypothetical protein